MVALQGPGQNVFEARDDFSHYHKVAARQNSRSARLSSKDVLALGEQVTLKGQMRRAAGLFGTLVTYGYALVGPLLYTWEAPRREGNSVPVHKIMEVMEASPLPNEMDLFPFVVKGFTAGGDVETWKPKAVSEQERQHWVSAINGAARTLRNE